MSTTSASKMFFFKKADLQPFAERFGDGYPIAQPFPHVVMDDFLPTWVADAALDEFPDPHQIAWTEFEGEQERKLAANDDESMPPFIRQLLAQFNSSVFIEFLESLTGITGLIPDPHFVGGGMHQIERDGLLKVHADFNWHKRLLLDRRLNLLIYLNKAWEEDYGGQLELWDKTMTHCEAKILPVFNRCVVFSTTDYSYHGHPNPLNCPSDRTRRSLALYYYTNGRPEEELTALHTTNFQPRPGEAWRRDDLGRSVVKSTMSRFAPPIVIDAARLARRRLKERRDRS